jgi:hypothetical protein
MIRSVWRRALGRFDQPKTRPDAGDNPGPDAPGNDRLSPYEIEDADIEEIKGKE